MMRHILSASALAGLLLVACSTESAPQKPAPENQAAGKQAAAKQAADDTKKAAPQLTLTYFNIPG